MQIFRLWAQVVRVAPATYSLHALAWSAVFGLPIMVGYTASKIVSGDGCRARLVAVFLGLFVCRAAIVLLSDRIEVVLSQRVMQSYGNALLESTYASFFRGIAARGLVGDLLTRFTRDTGTIATFACASSVSLSRAVFLLVAFAWLFEIDPAVGGVAVASSSAALILTGMLSARSLRHASTLEEQTTRDGNLLHTIMSASGSIVTSGAGQAFVNVLRRSFGFRSHSGISLGFITFANVQAPVCLLSLPIAALFLRNSHASTASHLVMTVTLLGFVVENYGKLTRIAHLHAQAGLAFERLNTWYVEPNSGAPGSGGPVLLTGEQSASDLVILAPEADSTEDRVVPQLLAQISDAGALLSHDRFGFEGSALDNLLLPNQGVDSDSFFAWYQALGFHDDFPDTDLPTKAIKRFAATPFASLSGGQVERLLCMRLLLAGYRRLVAWEPFTGVDSETLTSLIRNLRSAGIRQVYISADRVRLAA